jgi:hypothetical protein
MQTLTRALLVIGIVTVLPLVSQAQTFQVTTSPTTVEIPEDGAKFYVKNANTYVTVNCTSSHSYKITGTAGAQGIISSLTSKLTAASSTASSSLANVPFTLNSKGEWNSSEAHLVSPQVYVGGYTATATSELKLYGSNLTYTGTGTAGFSVVIGTPPPPPGT